MSEDGRRDDWYQFKGRLRGTLVGWAGLAILFFWFQSAESVPRTVGGLLSAIGLALFFVGWVISAHDAWAAWRRKGVGRRGR